MYNDIFGINEYFELTNQRIHIHMGSTKFDIKSLLLYAQKVIDIEKELESLFSENKTEFETIRKLYSLHTHYLELYLNSCNGDSAEFYTRNPYERVEREKLKNKQLEEAIKGNIDF